MADVTGVPNMFLTNPSSNNDGFGLGAITPLILGAALFGGRNGLFGNNGTDAAAAAVAARGATVDEVQGIVNGINVIQDIGATRREVASVSKDVWQAEGDVQAAVSASGTAIQNQVLQSQIASMQGQANIINSIDSHTNDISQSIERQTNALNSQFAVTNASIAANGAAAALAAKDAVIEGMRNTQIITANSDANATKVLAAIGDLKDSIPNAREINLQRELGVAQAELYKAQTSEVIRSGNVEVTNNINQTATQNATQVQIQGIIQALTSLAHNQTAMAGNLNILGTQTGITQTPVNVAR